MNCKDAQKKMIDMLDGSLSKRDKHNIKEHFSKCDDCREEYKTLENGTEAVETFVSHLPSENVCLTDERLAKIQEQFDGPRKIISVQRFTSVAAAAAAVVVAVVFLPSLLSSSGQSEHSYTTTTDETSVSAQQNTESKQESTESVQQNTQSTPRTAHKQEGSVSRWQVSLAKGEEQRAKTVNGYVEQSKDETNEKADPQNKRITMYRNNTDGLYVPVDKSVYDAERDGYWW